MGGEFILRIRGFLIALGVLSLLGAVKFFGLNPVIQALEELVSTVGLWAFLIWVGWILGEKHERLSYSLFGRTHCPVCGQEVKR